MRELALFAGAGGGILGGHLLGWRTVCAVEWDAYAASVLVTRQNDGTLAPFPVWDDVQTFDGRPWRGRVDVVSGGFPCTDISVAGRGAGIDGEASGMWRHMARVIGEVRPRHVLVENSPMLVRRGLARVLGDLAAMGYDARWSVLGAADAGAPHQRDRIWIVATDADGQQRRDQSQRLARGGYSTDIGDDGAQKPVAHPDRSQRQRDERPIGSTPQRADLGITDWWKVEPDVGRVAHGVASRVDRLRCIGNGQVPEVVRLAWRTLTDNQENDQ
jgi:DNA (cytosine-5)-methyltransferase 1